MPRLEWIGKEKVINHHLEVPFRVLNRKYSFDQAGQQDEDNGSANKIIHGDNLLALKSLLPEYEGKIKCIYIDPPYNTGNEGWVYNDNVNDPKMRKWLGEVVGKEGEDLSRHDKWLCMMYPRLKLLQKLLADDGAIFISIDDNEQAHLRLLCDEIFGIQNFVATIVWKKKTNGNNVGHMPSVHDFILVYAKSTDKLKLNGIPLSDDYIEKNFSNPDNHPRGLWTTTDLSANHKGPYFKIKNTKTGEEFYPPQGRYWVFNEDDVKKKINDGKIIFGKSGTARPVQRVFLNERDNLTQKQETWFDQQGYNADGMQELSCILGGKVLDHPKPVTLIKYILSIATNSNDIILDSFAGSGTTAQAVIELNKMDKGNRKYILVEMDAYADSITSERIKRIIQGYSAQRNFKKVLFSKKISISDFKNIKLYESVEEIIKKEKENFNKVESKIDNGLLKVVGVSSQKTFINGLKSDFSYYEIGEPLLEGDVLNPRVAVEQIRSYIWYMETRQPYQKPVADNEAFLGQENGTAYYFHYDPAQRRLLDEEFLRSITTRAEHYVIYADECLLSEAFLQKHAITFKKIPRDIARL